MKLQDDSENKKKNKKPEQPLYVPKPMQQAREHTTDVQQRQFTAQGSRSFQNERFNDRSQNRRTQNDRFLNDRYQGDRFYSDRSHGNKMQNDKVQGGRFQNDKLQPQNDRLQGEKFQSDKSHGEVLQSDRSQVDKSQSQNDRLKSDRSQNERFQSEGSYNDRLQSDKSQIDRSQNDRTQNDRSQFEKSHQNTSSNNQDRQNSNRSKRFSNRRRPNEDSRNLREEWRSQSPSSNYNRNLRQGSEPRNLGNNSNWNNSRQRDTRSVEPGGGGQRNYGGSEKIHLKPPSGRRHSTIGMEVENRRNKIPNFDSLPPRLQKKYLEEQKNSYANSNVTEDWDGSSITFQQQKQNYPQDYVGGRTQGNLYFTLPHNKPRGRGRFHQDYETNVALRPSTPDKFYSYSPCNSRSVTPPPGRMKHNENTSNSRPQTPVYPYKNQERGYRSNGSYKNSEICKSNEINKGNESSYKNKEGNYKNNEDNYKNIEGNYKKYEGDYKNSEGSFKNNEGSYKCNENYSRNTKYGDECNKNSWNKEEISTDRLSKNVYDEKLKSSFDEKGKQFVSGFRPSLEALLSPVSPDISEANEVKTSALPMNDVILVSFYFNISSQKIQTAIFYFQDWSEEVELNDRLEAEAQSDALTRSSSVASLMDNNSTLSMGSKKSKRKKNRNRRRYSKFLFFLYC